MTAQQALRLPPDSGRFLRVMADDMLTLVGGGADRHLWISQTPVEQHLLACRGADEQPREALLPAVLADDPGHVAVVDGGQRPERRQATGRIAATATLQQ
ncbi:hypothetical protein TPA0907_00120 [Micromonospora humidisoli]|uniref:hypothetical protein n=1 Tax=Micromonospora sp. AKA109 TaxID=2733865 RepID=UPI0022CB40BD|nr:hypothetical protein [Micromonospora sp. AKA109]GHJ05645.1 hypothetical protein TPA0907_00120 [Micromonospora sp. AKA109]